ncbi:ferrous iron transport protein b [Heliomicrobium modesticaldum Ice1]|uniref:Ferrous iron transport protein B n=1 Tax=Heliobacterium modesticaldum (strain ATCC 51547 / Ice1) TaxID=498761 RepID=B0TE92_HELMI|nr:ferrous iron transport protein B [Heliomicrobium modesticaldum]ABZ85574.1 ferrous iron transport protein b [Heliomicrobium modesticaldum Ice1]
MSAITVALAGNPNTGKTTLFNALTGAHQHIGNWPGVTVEKAVGRLKKADKTFTIVDLPGTYSISAYSLEERIVADYLNREKPDVVVNVVDASNLERNLYLTVQLIEAGTPLLIALNMVDEAKQKGVQIDTDALSRCLGVPVAPTVATRKEGLRDLVERFDPAAYQSKAQQDPLLTEYLAQADSLRAAEDEDALIEARYAFISDVLARSARTEGPLEASFSDRLDNILTHRVLGIPIFLTLMYLMFEVTFTWVGQPLADLLDGWISGPFTEWASESLVSLGVAEWMQSLIVDGIIAGVGGVVVFAPIIFTLFLFISILDGSGYMARVAFIMDQAMRKIGLSGKAFLPMLIGFGCSVPAIMGARVLDSERDRRIAALIAPLMSCSARLPVYALFTALFFAEKESLVVFSLYVLGIALAILMGILFKKTLLKGESEPFVMELPPYRLPSWQTVLTQTWEKGKGFLIKADTIIFSMSVVIWLLSNFNLEGPAEIQDSFLAAIGSIIAPLFTFHGFASWESGVAILTGILAKEAVISTLGIVYGIGELSEEAVDAAAQMLPIAQVHFTALSAYAFMVFTLIYTPCMAALATLKKELGSWKWTLLGALYPFALAWLMSLVVYQVGRLLGFEG